MRPEARQAASLGAALGQPCQLKKWDLNQNTQLSAAGCAGLLEGLAGSGALEELNASSCDLKEEQAASLGPALGQLR